MTAMRWPMRHRLDLVVGDVDGRGLEPVLQLEQSRRASARAAWRRGSRAARRTGTPRACARWRGRARRAGAGRPRAAWACGRAASSMPRIAAASFTSASISSGRVPCGSAGRTRCSRAPSCAGRARSSGTPSRCRGPWAHVVDHPVADADRASAQLLEPRDHAQRRRLAAARGTDEHHELVVVDRRSRFSMTLTSPKCFAMRSSSTFAMKRLA